jgi:hypothetical protein
LFAPQGLCGTVQTLGPKVILDDERVAARSRKDHGRNFPESALVNPHFVGHSLELMAGKLRDIYHQDFVIQHTNFRRVFRDAHRHRETRSTPWQLADASHD